MHSKLAFHWRLSDADGVVIPQQFPEKGGKTSVRLREMISHEDEVTGQLSQPPNS